MAVQISTIPTQTAGRTVAETIVAQLALWGVQYVFGVQGRSILGLTDALRRQDAIQYIQTRHEEAAALMASAYAKLTGRLGVCAAPSGPGVTNLLTGLLDAQADSAPVLALCGQEGRPSFGRGGYQAIDQHALLETSSRFNHNVVDPEATPRLLALACKAALERPGVARLGIPGDLERIAVKAPLIGPTGHLIQERWAAPPQRIAEAVEMLAGAQRPVILAGRGAVHCREAVIRCAEIFDAPIVTTCPGKAVVPFEYEHTVGVVGRFGIPIADDLVRRSDVLLVIGSSLSENTTRGWNLIPDATRIVQIDHNPWHVGRNYAVAVPLIGDSFLTLEHINQTAMPVNHPDYHQEVANQKRDWIARSAQRATSDAIPILPERVIYELGKACASDAIITVDVGDHAVFYCQYFPVRNQTTLMSSHMGVMGFSVPAASAAKLACPNRQVIALCGDGGFSSIMGEFLTACQYHLPVAVVLLNNNELGMTLTEQTHDQFQPAGFFTSLAGCNFAAFAHACGALGLRVTRPEEILPALERAFAADVPSLVQIDIDPGERPSFAD